MGACTCFVKARGSVLPPAFSVLSLSRLVLTATAAVARQWQQRQLQLAGSPGSCRSFPPVSEVPLAPGSEREAGAQLFSSRIGPEGADVTRLLGALLGGDDAPPTAREQLYCRSGNTGRGY